MGLMLEVLKLFIINNLFILSNLQFQNFVVSIFHNGGSLNVGILNHMHQTRWFLGDIR
jgi:hypothetical protein